MIDDFTFNLRDILTFLSTDSKTTKYFSGRYCAYRIDVYNRLYHWQLKIILRLLEVVDTKEDKDQFYREEYDNYEFMLNVARGYMV